MKIGSFTNSFQVKNNNRVNNASYPCLAPLKKDTISFGVSLYETDKSGGVKKSEIKKKLEMMEIRYASENGPKYYPRFDENEIAILLPVANKENIRLLEYFAMEKDNHGRKRYDCYEIADLISVVNKDNFHFYKELSLMKNKDGNYRFGGSNIAKIISVINEDNKPIFKKLAGMENNKGCYRFNGFEISKIFPVVSNNEANMSKLEKLVNEETDNNTIIRILCGKDM